MSDDVSVKICGITTVEDALMCVEAGADALGLCFWPGSKRYVQRETAREIMQALPDSVEVVAVVVNECADALHRLREEVGIQWVQLHGDEPPELLERFLPYAYKAMGIGTARDVERLSDYPGDRVLVDKAVAGLPGGTGETFDWHLVHDLVSRRRVILAGGLNPDNVGRAVHVVRPYRVDVASGVERSPGRKDEEKVRAFIARARDAVA